ncbi:MAG: M28 family peptidase [Ignavibacteria bacterium]|nr:M28 family peptidase [Ignavibacteria bacterium]
MRQSTRLTLRWLIHLILALAVLPARGFAQSTPFLSDDEIRMLQNEISGDRSFEHIRALSRWHRESGSEGYFKAVDYVLEAAKAAGLEEVRFVEQPLMSQSYTARTAELWMIEPVEIKLADIGDHALFLADGSHSANLSAELVWIGDANTERLKNIDVKGKIVLTSSSPGRAVVNAVWAKGAIGVVCYPTSEGKSILDFPDQIAWTRIPMVPPEGKQGTFAFVLSPRKGEMLKELLETGEMQDIFATGKRTKGGRVVLKAKVETEISEVLAKTGFVEGWIRGTKYPDQQIVITAHLQEEQGSANDDGSGCGNILELGRVFTKLIKEGKMPRPLRDIRFWWTDEIYSEYRYFMDNPEEPKRFLANLHQDMTGANQSMGNRVQHLIFAPHSRTSYLDAIFESVGTYVIQTNNAFLAASRQGGLPRPFTRPIYATRGTRQGYNARFVPYFGSSDHMCFLDAHIGVPAVGMINWDDEFIHSTDDDLDKIDQTQLQRNNFIVGAMAFVLSFAEKDDVRLIVGETYAQGAKRLSNDLQSAMDILRTGKGDAASRWKDALIVIEQGVEREVRAVRSAAVFAGNDKNSVSEVEKLAGHVRESGKEHVAAIQTYYRQLYGKTPSAVALTPDEQKAAKKTPTNNPQLAEYFQKRQQTRYRGGLHGLMREEVYRFVDGKRSYYDIYKAVRAEALTTGSWYYGTVELADVVGMLDAAVGTGALSLR